MLGRLGFSNLVFQVTKQRRSFHFATSKIVPNHTNFDLNSIKPKPQNLVLVTMSTHKGKSETPASVHSVSDSSSESDNDTTKTSSKTHAPVQQKEEDANSKSKGKPNQPLSESEPIRYATRNKILTKEQEIVEHATARILSLDIEEKRKLYKCRDRYTTLDNIPTWPEHFSEALANDSDNQRFWKRNKSKVDSDVNPDLSAKISVFCGDITSLEIDAIVNAANESLLGGGGVDGAIHSAAGSDLVKECRLLRGCSAGEAKITFGYKLPAKHVIHTVGPRGERPEVLENCYRNCLDLMKSSRLTSVAFPCISTGIFGYPNENAAEVALKTVRSWLDTEDYAKQIERVIFCLFLDKDIKIYNEQIQMFFPLERDE